VDDGRVLEVSAGRVYGQVKGGGQTAEDQMAGDTAQDERDYNYHHSGDGGFCIWEEELVLTVRI
jgi:hypothetical protein